MHNDWFIIINPTSGNGKSKKHIPKILQLLKQQQITYNYAITKYVKHEFELVQNAITNGYHKIISVGGDGTLHNIVNGILHQSVLSSSLIKIAVIPFGTGNDWVKNYQISKDLSKNISTIKSEHTTYQDIGKITLNSTKTIVYFNNLAGIGFDGHVVNSIGKYKKYGAISYLLAVFVGFSKYKSVDLSIELDNKIIEVNSLMTLIGLCKYSGGGMRLTEKSDPTNGLFDITIIKHLNLATVLVNLPKLFNGKITKHRKVTTYKTNNISISLPKNKTVFMQADGELIDSENFTVELIPKAIQVITPKKS
ncbi:diacylglycerol/lipid kinase family protein [Urechidicola vernalis]|uniref:Diacylglycerol kinase family lipid kinase n=1 Tax=Urechidicola vernalis TaxID=3075600 RepID=A0ABU2Y5Z3_9FLAO|nr:diacylglycerol kinase family lipid kinase [Urechidicola sp. P050]MDT0553628.1 diacylglycerol kinase family lipid kinase [Urechidicola sp. P050]